MSQKWGRLLLPAILALCVICSTGCISQTRIEYRPADEQVFIVPQASKITAPQGKAIVTDGPDGKVELGEIVTGYRGILLSEGYFLKLYREKVEGQ